MALAFRWIQLLPSETYLLEALIRLRQAVKQALSCVHKFPDIKRPWTLESAVLALDDGQKLAAQGEVFA
jgi:hypothetical protein